MDWTAWGAMGLGAVAIPAAYVAYSRWLVRRRLRRVAQTLDQGSNAESDTLAMKGSEELAGATVTMSLTDLWDLTWFQRPEDSTVWMRIYEFIMAQDAEHLGRRIDHINFLGLPIKLTYGHLHDFKVPRMQTTIARPRGQIPSIQSKMELVALPEAAYVILTCPLQIDTGRKGPGDPARVTVPLDCFAALLRSHLGTGGLWQLVYEGERFAHNGVWASLSGSMIRFPQPVEGPDYSADRWDGIDQVAEAISKSESHQRRAKLALRYLNRGCEDSEFINYWTAFEILCGNAGKIRAALRKAYGFDKQHDVDDQLQFDVVRGWRIDLIHKGTAVALSAEVERYLQFLFLDLIRHVLGLDHLGYAKILLDDLDLDLTGVQRTPPTQPGTSTPPAQTLVREALALEAVDANQAEDLYRKGVEQFPDSSQVLGAFANFLVQIKGDHTAAERMYTRALAADPRNATALGNYANLLRIQGHSDSAEEKYQAAIAADPQHATHLGNYSTFLWEVRGDFHATDEMFGKALQADPQRTETRELYSNFLSNWAVDLWDTGNIDGAEQRFQRSLEVDAANDAPLGNYANFLWIVRKDFDRAQEMYEKALQADPHCAAHHLTNRAGFLLACRSRDDGLQALSEARDALLGEDETLHAAQKLECAFYAFVHGSRAAAPEALWELRRFLDRGFRSPDADLLPNIEKAEADDYRERSWLLKLASVINDDEAPDALGKWPLWASLGNAREP